MQSCATAKVQKILLTSQAKTSLDKVFEGMSEPQEYFISFVDGVQRTAVKKSRGSIQFIWRMMKRCLHVWVKPPALTGMWAS